MDNYETADRLVRLSEKAANNSPRADQTLDSIALAFADMHRRQRRSERWLDLLMITFLVLVVLSGLWVAVYLALRV